MRSFNENWDGIRRKSRQDDDAAPISESSMRHFTDIGDFAKNVRDTAMRGLKPNEVKIYLLQVAGSLSQMGQQQKNFLDGLLSSLEDAKKDMSTSRHGTVSPCCVAWKEMRKDLETIIQQLKKYKA
jgi:hypothetical protein